MYIYNEQNKQLSLSPKTKKKRNLGKLAGSKKLIITSYYAIGRKITIVLTIDPTTI